MSDPARGRGRRPRLTLRGVALLALGAACAHSAAGAEWAAPGAPLARLEAWFEEQRYWRDQLSVTLQRHAGESIHGVPLDSLRARDAAARDRVRTELERARRRPLIETERFALATLERVWESGLSRPAADDETSSEAIPECTHDAAQLARADGLDDLTHRVFACYGAAAHRIVVDDDTLNRLAILGLLGRSEDPARRQRLFLALGPVWQSVNGLNDSASPYRALVRLRRDAWGASNSPIEAKGPAFGIAPDTLEAWLIRALERWRRLSPDTLVEPWNWFYHNGAMSRRLSPRVGTIADLRAVNDSFYRSLGADPVALNFQYELVVRPGKSPVAFTDFGARGRYRGGRWSPGEPWIFASYLSGGVDNLAELLHETGHAIHIAAIRTRPAYLDWPDNDTFTEALADLAALELYDPAWQQRFLGDSAPQSESLRAKYAWIMLDMTWGLFEIRIHRDPAADPNALWVDLAMRYLGIRPHPEWSWWAMRGQLVDGPGYLLNYALGAFIAADLRDRLASACPGCLQGNLQYFRFASDLLYRFGLERPSREILESFLGRQVRPDALLAELERARAAD